MVRTPSTHCCSALPRTFLERRPSLVLGRRRIPPVTSRLPVRRWVAQRLSRSQFSPESPVRRHQLCLVFIEPISLWFATLFPLSLLALCRSRRSCLVLVLLGCLIATTGCGAGRAIPLESGSNPNPTPIPITPAGTYTIVASATSGGLTRSVNLTLIVQ